MKFSKIKPFLKHHLLLMELIALWYLYDNIHQRGRFFFLIAALLVVMVILSLLISKTSDAKPIRLHLLVKPAWLMAIFGLLTLALVAAFFTLRLQLFNSGSGRMLAGFILAGLGALLLFLAGHERSPYLNFAVFLLILGVLYRLAAFLPEIQSRPFSLGWSEGSRFYNASLFLSGQIYGMQLPLPVLDPSRYLMQAVPFLFGSQSILFHRLWQVLLWLGLTGLGSYQLARRVKDGVKLPVFLLVLWFSLFFLQGAVYYHLMVCVILVLLGYRKDKPWRTLVFVALASVWAGISRINWMPVPGLLATALYLMDEPFDGQHWGKYLKFPVLWAAVGFAMAYISKQAYVTVSGEDPALFDSAFSSSLLWQRLFPNATFFLGILLGIGLVCLPLGVLVWKKMHDPSAPRLHWLRWLGLGVILLVFLIGGILVSLKIGGGGDLHNLDAFLAFWALIMTSLLANKIVPDQPPAEEGTTYQMQPFWLMMAVVVPVFFAFMHTGSWNFPSRSAQEPDLQRLQQALDLLQDQPGEVLFISERQLVTFDELKGVRMVPEYEKDFLMEMAMGNNQPYLQEFYQQINAHRFKAIISDPLSTNIQDNSHSFAAENNTWVEKVLLPMLDVYEPVLSWQNGAVNLLIPKDQIELRDDLLQLQQ
ncbi:MAG: hypothetical protein WA110_03570 [Anaerolineaceae bacterium]